MTSEGPEESPGAASPQPQASSGATSRQPQASSGAASPRPHVVLIGMMGSGKSTVGRLLAAELDRPFLDSDRVIEQRAGRTIAEVFEGDGESAFRALESEVLAELLASDDATIIAVGGGAVLDASTRARLRERAFSVWLRATVIELRARLGSGFGRPLLGSDEDLAATLDRLDGERAAIYEEVADVTIDVDGTDPAAVARAVVAIVEETPA